MTPCRWVTIYRRSEGALNLYLQGQAVQFLVCLALKPKALQYQETSSTAYPTRLHTQNDLNLQLCRC
jgi:hypothetical protein